MKTILVVSMCKDISVQCSESCSVVKSAAEQLADEIESHKSYLAKAWEQYIKIIDLLIALVGATALILVNITKEIGIDKLKSPTGTFTLCSFGIALFCLAFWRFSAQHFYEYETIGSARIARAYYEKYGLTQHITRAHLVSAARRTAYRECYRLFAFGSGVAMLASWISLIILILE